LVAACFTWRKHAHEDSVGPVSIDDDHPLLQRLGIRENDNGRSMRRLCGTEAGQSG
jgi:hypothetical protein